MEAPVDRRVIFQNIFKRGADFEDLFEEIMDILEAEETRYTGRYKFEPIVFNLFDALKNMADEIFKLEIKECEEKNSE